jgi:PAS domain S-box-containing protein
MGSSTVGMCITTPEGTFEVVNDALCEFFGYDPTTLCKKTWQELTAPEDLGADLTKVEGILAGHLDGYRTTKQFIHSDGHRRWGGLSVSCLRGLGGEVQKFIAQVVDVTAEVTAEQELARYKRLIDTSNVGTALSNLDGSVAFVNQAMCDQAGRDLDTAMQMTWMQVVPEANLQALFGVMADLLAGRIDSYR